MLSREPGRQLSHRDRKPLHGWVISNVYNLSYNVNENNISLSLTLLKKGEKVEEKATASQ